MSRGTYGGTLADFVVKTAPTTGYLKLGAATLNFYSAKTGGTHYTDLLLGATGSGGAATTITVGSDGQIPSFQGPDGVTQMWADAGAGARVLMNALTDLASLTAAFGAGSDLWLKATGGDFGFTFTVITSSDATGLPTAGTVKWPDGTTGAFTGTTDGTNGYTGWSADYGAGGNKRTLTATGITYDPTTGLPLGPTGLAVA